MTEFTALAGVIVLLLFGGFQLCMWLFTRQMVTAAASEGVVAAAAADIDAGSAAAAGEQSAREMLGHGWADRIDALTVTRDEDRVTVVITVSNAPGLLPALSVTGTAVGPIERFVPAP